MTAESTRDPQPRPADSAAPPTPPGPVLDWNADALAAQLAPLWPGIGVEVVASAGSTNSELLARGRAAGAAGLAPRLLVAERQTGGRGRLGRAWQSQRGASLTCSLALPLAPADWSGLSLAVGVALAEALDGDGDGEASDSGSERQRIRLKWPNDLWLVGAADDGAPAAAGGRADRNTAGRKLGGILIETLSTGEQRRLAVIGIGLNVLPFAADAAPPPATPLAFLNEIDALASAPRALARLMPPLLRALRRFERSGFAAFASRFAARDALAGRAVRLEPAAASLIHADAAVDDDELAGTAEGVNAAGALRVRTRRGRLREVVGGEISVRLSAAASLPAPVPAPPSRQEAPS